MILVNTQDYNRTTDFQALVPIYKESNLQGIQMAKPKKTNHRTVVADFNYSNVKINLYLTPVNYIVVYLLSLNYSVGIKSEWITDPHHATAIFSCLVYIWASRFFQPDLDQHPNRPGKGSFPFGKTVTNAVIAFFNVILRGAVKRSQSKYLATLSVYGPIAPLSLLWFHLWTPYALLLTHRGLSHWPIIGTLSRVGYLHLTLIVIQAVLQTEFPQVELFIKRFYFWKGVSPEFFLLCAPVYISDILHSSGDMVESMVKGYSFCPPAIKGGLISKIIRFRI